MENNIPQLRFPEFEEKWGKEKLINVSRYFNGGSFENDVQEKGKYELITLKSVDVGGNLVNSKRFIDIDAPTLSKGTLIMILSEQAPGLLGMTTLIPCDNKYVLNQRVAEIRPNNKVESFFLSMAINRKQRYFSRLGAGTKVQNISKPNVENYEFFCPSLPEQTRIANFLTSVDKRITLLQKKITQLEQYKKGIMQKIFFQEFRFKKEDGSDFPDWEEKMLGDVIKDYRLGGNYKNTESPTQFPLIKMGNIGRGKMNINKIEYIPETEKVDDSDLIKKDDIFFNTRNTLELVGKVSIWRNELPIAYYNSNLMYMKFENNVFMNYLLNSYFLIKGLRRIATGTTSVAAIYTKDLLKLKLVIPHSSEEQQKIASFLSSIDKSIEKLDNQIKESEKFKQGLLQKMFV